MVIISFVYALPVIILSICPTILFSVPISTTGGGNDTMTYVGYFAWACFGLIAFLYGILCAFLIPAAIGRYASTDQLGEAFKFREVFALVKAAPMAYLIVILGTFVSGIIAPLGMILCIVGVLATASYSISINAHLQGQAYLEATSQANIN